ncbi:MAG: hypothetical protein WDN31_02430 [Hyphomicrobium sp.]
MEALDGSARYFFQTEFFHPSFSATKKQILKRLWGVLSTPAFERMFAQRDNELDLFEATNDGKIILISTAKDLLKTEGSALFGRFFIAMLAQAALERSAVPEWRRNPTFLYVDEAQEYFDDTIETILSPGPQVPGGHHGGAPDPRPALAAPARRLPREHEPQVRRRRVRQGRPRARERAAYLVRLHRRDEEAPGAHRVRGMAEVAVWLKGRTPEALRLDVPLGFLERQATLGEEEYDRLVERNRARYCGTRADVLSFAPPPKALRAPEAIALPVPELPAPNLPPVEEPSAAPLTSAPPSPPAPPRPAAEARELGKGGPKHRYLQSLVKGLAEQQGFRATVEAPLAEGTGQVDVLLEREGVAVAVEISVTTPVAQEQQNVRKCLDAGYGRVAVVLAKSRATDGRYRAAILETLTDEERGRVSLLAPEDVPDFIAALAPPPAPAEMVVKGYRVKVSHTSVPPEEAKERRDRLAKLVARSLRREE